MATIAARRGMTLSDESESGDATSAYVRSVVRCLRAAINARATA